MHLKRLLAPRFWMVPRKKKAWVVSPRPGPHKKLESIPLQVLLRDVLGVVEKGKEARIIVKRREVSVDGRKRKDHAYPVGLFDVVSIPTIGKNYRAVPSKKTISFIEIPEKEAGLKLCKIVGKTSIRKGKTQINLHDGRNILTDKKDFNTGDSLLVEVPSMKIVEHVSLKEGAVGIVTKGTEVGKVGKVKEIKTASNSQKGRVACEFDGKEKEVLRDRFFVVGKEKSLLKLA